MVEIFLSIYLFYLGFALSVSIYRQWIKGTLNVLNKLLFAPILIIFIILDIILNILLIIPMGFPLNGVRPPASSFERYTISYRFEIYREKDHGWKTTLANLVCEKLLNTVDPTGTHC